jgi:hypothetical protein
MAPMSVSISRTKQSPLRPKSFGMPQMMRLSSETSSRPKSTRSSSGVKTTTRYGCFSMSAPFVGVGCVATPLSSGRGRAPMSPSTPSFSGSCLLTGVVFPRQHFGAGGAFYSDGSRGHGATVVQTN